MIDPLIVAHEKTILGLLEMIPQEDNEPLPQDMSFPHIRWMMETSRDHLGIWPIDKISRWIGCVQGVMRCRGVLDFSVERDRTRPFFHEAYTALGQKVPQTTSRTLDTNKEPDEEMWQTGQNAQEALMEEICQVLNSEATRTFLTGRVMAKLHGSANPQVIRECLDSILPC